MSIFDKYIDNPHPFAAWLDNEFTKDFIKYIDQKVNDNLNEIILSDLLTDEGNKRAIIAQTAYNNYADILRVLDDLKNTIREANEGP